MLITTLKEDKLLNSHGQAKSWTVEFFHSEPRRFNVYLIMADRFMYASPMNLFSFTASRRRPFVLTTWRIDLGWPANWIRIRFKHINRMYSFMPDCNLKFNIALTNFPAINQNKTQRSTIFPLHKSFYYSLSNAYPSIQPTCIHFRQHLFRV